MGKNGGMIGAIKNSISTQYLNFTSSNIAYLLFSFPFLHIFWDDNVDIDFGGVDLLDNFYFHDIDKWDFVEPNA